MPKITAAKRKLLPQPLMAELHNKWSVGVSISRLLRDYNLNISRTLLVKLLQMYDKHYLTNEEITASLFPPWLDNALANSQEQPDNWSYQGYFPLGVWVKNENN